MITPILTAMLALGPVQAGADNPSLAFADPQPAGASAGSTWDDFQACGSLAGGVTPTAGMRLPLEEMERILGLEPVRPGDPAVSVQKMGVSNTYTITLAQTGTGYKEKYLLQVPPHFGTDPKGPRPLLVAFHKFGSTVQDIPVNTSFEEECLDRGWFLVAPLGASTKSFSSLQSQINTELVLTHLKTRLGGAIDASRIYAVGFSMGANNALNFAARHLDQDGPMFAAIVDHSGAMSHPHSYVNNEANQFLFEFWFGGTPEQKRFEYLRSSMFDMVKVAESAAFGGLPGTGGTGGTGGVPIDNDGVWQVRKIDDLARNLTHVPLKVVRGQHDPNEHMVLQTDLFVRHFSGMGGKIDFEIVPGVFTHEWATLDQKGACDWLSQHSLNMPRAARTLADRDGTYFYFDVTQAESGSFSPFSWRVDSDANRLDLLETANIDRVSLRTRDAGLDPFQTIELNLGAFDGLGDEVVLRDIDLSPSIVLRDGVMDNSWKWNAMTKSLRIIESDGERHTWTIVPPTAQAASSKFRSN